MPTLPERLDQKTTGLGQQTCAEYELSQNGIGFADQFGHVAEFFLRELL